MKEQLKPSEDNRSAVTSFFSRISSSALSNCEAKLSIFLIELNIPTAIFSPYRKSEITLARHNTYAQQ